MQTIRVRSRAGEDGVLHLRIPLGNAGAEYEVLVVLQPLPPDGQAGTPEALGWPPGFFEETAGAWQGEFIREQGEYEKREEL